MQVYEAQNKLFFFAAHITVCDTFTIELSNSFRSAELHDAEIILASAFDKHYMYTFLTF